MGISLLTILARIEAHTLTMKKVTTMTISHVKRYAEDISVKNDIYNFNELFPNVVGLSAISWE